MATDRKCCRCTQSISLSVISFFFMFLKPTASRTETHVRKNKSEGKNLAYFTIFLEISPTVGLKEQDVN